MHRSHGQPKQSKTTNSSLSGWVKKTTTGRMSLSSKEANCFLFEGLSVSDLSVAMYVHSPQNTTITNNSTKTDRATACCRFDAIFKLLKPPPFKGGNAPDNTEDKYYENVVYLIYKSTVLNNKFKHFNAFLFDFDKNLWSILLFNNKKPNHISTLYSVKLSNILQFNTFINFSFIYSENRQLCLLNDETILYDSNYAGGQKHLSLDARMDFGVACWLNTICISRFKIIDDYIEEFASITKKTNLPMKKEIVKCNSNQQQQPSKSTSIAEYSPIDDLIVSDLKTGFADIAGLNLAKRSLNESVVLPIVCPDLFQESLLTPWKGILLFGPPGNGKTMLARAVATMCNNATSEVSSYVSFFNVSVSNLISKWRGDSEKLLTQLFAVASDRAPSILFFDEIDSVLSSRGGLDEHEASRRFKSEFFILMDGLISVDNVIVICTTNCPWDLDSALLRRLEKRIYVPLPSREGRFEIFKKLLKNHIDDDETIWKFADETSDYSGSDIKTICRDALLSPMRRAYEKSTSHDEILNIDEFRSAIGNHKMTVDMDDVMRAIKTTPTTVVSTMEFEEWNNKYGSK